MGATCLELQNPIRDAISRIRFAPSSNNLLISSWDSNLRLYDVDRSTLRVEAPSEAGLLDCCFQNELVAFSVGSDCCVRRHDLDSGIQDTIGSHGDFVCCVEYSDKMSQLITAGWDRKLMFWDTRSKTAVRCLDTPGEVESMSVNGFNLMFAIGSLVKVYDWRDLNESAYVKELCMCSHVRCVRPNLNYEGFVAGSVDGQVAVEHLNSNDRGYVFWSHPKSKDGTHHAVAVNDIAFSPSISGAFVTGNEKGYITAWDALSKRRLQQFSRYSNSAASLSYNCGGQLLAVATSHTYGAENEIEEAPQIFIHEMKDFCVGPSSARSSKFNKVSGSIM